MPILLLRARNLDYPTNYRCPWNSWRNLTKFINWKDIYSLCEDESITLINLMIVEEDIWGILIESSSFEWESIFLIKNVAPFDRDDFLLPWMLFFSDKEIILALIRQSLLSFNMFLLILWSRPRLLQSLPRWWDLYFQVLRVW